MRNTLVIAILCVVTTAKSQNVDPSIVSPAAGSGKSGSISLEWTTGEFAIETVSTSNTVFTQGFHQPYLTVTSTLLAAEDSRYKISIAPNPVLSMLNINLGMDSNRPLFLRLTDAQGKLFRIQAMNRSSNNLQLDLRWLPPGTYLLSINEAAIVPKMRTYKIVKL